MPFTFRWKWPAISRATSSDSTAESTCGLMYTCSLFRLLVRSPLKDRPRFDITQLFNQLFHGNGKAFPRPFHNITVLPRGL